MFCSETCLIDNISDAEININGYKLNRCDSHSRHTGGVAIYVRENIAHEVIYKTAIDCNVWFLSIKVKTGGRKGIYSAVYHSPNSSHSVFINTLEQILSETVDNELTNLVIGDFNIDLIRSQYAGRLERICASFALKQKIDFVTRATNISETKIDLVFTNDDRVLCYPLSDEKISDHETIAVQITNRSTKLLAVERQIRCWDGYSKENLISILQNTNWGR